MQELLLDYENVIVPFSYFVGDWMSESDETNVIRITKEETWEEEDITYALNYKNKNTIILQDFMQEAKLAYSTPAKS